MTTPQLALADELAAIRAEIARLRTRETALASIEHSFPKVPVFRRSLPVQVAPRNGMTVMTAAHA
jgi:hypothetical protein